MEKENSIYKDLEDKAEKRIKKSRLRNQKKKIRETWSCKYKKVGRRKCEENGTERQMVMNVTETEKCKG